VNAVDKAALLRAVEICDDATSKIGGRTFEILESRRRTAIVKRRGWLVRRALLVADLVGLALAFLIAQLLFSGLNDGKLDQIGEFAAFGLSLPLWAIVAKLYGLYDRDEERTDHSTVDDLVGVFHVITVGTWILYAGAYVTRSISPEFPKVAVFWAAAVFLVAAARGGARSFCRRQITYLQNALIVGAGDVGQLVARKIVQHREYGINIVGFVDANPRELRADLKHVRVLGGPDDLAAYVRLFDVERVIVAFSEASEQETLEVVRMLNDLDVQIDIVPRLFELVGPKVEMHSIEALPLVGLPPMRIARSSRAFKRTIDVIAAGATLALTAPLFAYVALRIRLDSKGPVFFRQTRLGLEMEEFTLFKFRTMQVGTKDDEHRAFIKASMNRNALPQANGVFKLERDKEITRVGRWLRRTSLDELPQLINVLRGEMSLVGPRPCLRYETEHFKQHHFERFSVPQGITGLWQVMARAHSTFAEALDMDVAYARGWSLGLDLQLLARTPLQLLRPKGTR
jgi:exopolysaccharide biosynthesis polyprenyl glycosylphosphotransferase